MAVGTAAGGLIGKFAGHKVQAAIGEGLAAKAPHPNAALLYLDYLYSDGQKILEDNFYSTGATPVSFTPWTPEQGKSAAQIENDVTQWNATFNTIFRGR